MAAPKTTLILPVESQVRELDAKLLLACVAAESGFRSVIGSRAYVHYRMASIDRGVYLAKSMRSLSRLVFRLLNDLGHEIVAWDEEALVRIPTADYYRRRLDPEVLSCVTQLLCWGDSDADVFRGYPKNPGVPVEVTGNPRVDLMRSELRGYHDDEVSRIRRRFGDFILVNTNFGYVNAFVPNLNLMQPSPQPGEGLVPGLNTKGMTPDFARGIAAHKRVLFEHFVDLLPRLAAQFPEHTIVLRPHPSESHDAWHEAARGHENVAVINEGSVVPWLMACSALIHNGCTTAVEAAVLNVPAIAFCPARDKAYDLELPNQLSCEIVGPEDVLEQLNGVVSGTSNLALTPDQQALLGRHLAALDGPLAVDRIVETLSRLGFRDRLPDPPKLHRYAWAWLATQSRMALKRSRKYSSDHRNSAQFHSHRFPGTSVEDLEARVRRLSAQVGRFKDVRVRELWEHVYSIESER
jgi:surface carbohydrate biosynthesis protein